MNITLDAGTLAILITIIFQTGGMIWWASNVTARIKHLEHQSDAYGDIGGRLSSLESSIKAISLTMDRMYKELQMKVDK